MKQDEAGRLAARVSAANAALRTAIADGVRVMTDDAAVSGNIGNDELRTIRSIFKSRVLACVEVFRETGIREVEILPAVHRAISTQTRETNAQFREEVTSQLLQWSTDALAPVAPWVDPTQHVESADLDQLRVEMIGAIRDAYLAPGLGTFHSRRLRSFDASWNKMEWEVRRFGARIVATGSERGASTGVIDAALNEAVPGLAPNHPLRASVIAWFAAGNSGRD